MTCDERNQDLIYTINCQPEDPLETCSIQSLEPLDLKGLASISSTPVHQEPLSFWDLGDHEIPAPWPSREKEEGREIQV